MYHYRYQPPTPHLANRNANAFATNNHRSNSSSVTRINNTQAAADLGPINYHSNNSLASHQPTNKRAPNYGNHHKTGVNSVYHSGAYSSQPRQFAEERQDVIFRKVRGILNKITPETFDKLSNELVNVGLDSPRTLRGLIYLLFDKALKDLKYSSLYAKLCQELSEKAPNFEQEPGPNTFCKFLISKCEDEFERRRKATEDFDGKHELTDEEFEQKAIAKQKMLGNIKFICELGKKRLLQEEILHECIRGLLSKKKERPLQDQAQDLECLCQIMRTIGSLLDIEASRNLMNQYFERIDMYSRKPDLPSRIRFMLRDVIDLRNNKWRPRPFQKEDNVPQPLSKLREEAGFQNNHGAVDKTGNTKNLKGINDLSRMHSVKFSSLLLEDDGPSFTTTTDFHWGSNTFMPNETEFDIFSATMPIQQKIGTKTTNPQSSYKDFTDAGVPAPRHPYPNHTSTISSQRTGMTENLVSHNNNNGIASMHGRIDPFSDSFKVNKHGRPQTTKEMFGPYNRNDGRHGSGPDRKAITRDRLTTSNMIIEKFNHNSTAIVQQERDSFSQHDRGNITGYETRHPDARLLPVKDERYSSLRLQNNPSRPMLQTRDGRISPNGRFANGPRGLDEPPPNARSPPPHPQNSFKLQNPQRRNFDDGIKTEQRMTNDQLMGNHLGRERRFEREPRQPKFSGANYRLPGRDRPQVAPPRPNQPPESELSTNWRATGAPAVSEAKGASLDLKTDKSSVTTGVLERLETTVPTNFMRPDLRDTKSTIKNDRSSCVDPIRRNGTALLPPAGEHVEHNLSNSMSSPSCGHNSINESPEKKNSNARNVEMRQVEGHAMKSNDDFTQSRYNPPKSLVNEDGQQNHQLEPEVRNQKQLSRPNHNDQPDLKARDRPPLRSQIDNEDRRHRSRENFDSRNYRPAFSRNQSFEAKTTERDRAQNWRKEVIAQAAKKENSALGLVTSGLLTKPPVRMSETDFSLRPSHNLVGRVLAENPTSASIPSIDSNPDKKTPKANPEIKPPPRTQPDGPTMNSKPHVIKDKVDATPGVFPENAASEFHMKKFISLLNQYSSMNSSETSKMTSKIRELKIPKSYQSECLVIAIKQSITGTEADRNCTCKLLNGLVPSAFESSSLLKSFKIIFEQLNALEAETPKVKSLVAEFLSRTVVDGLLNLEDVAGVLIGGKHHPLFLLLLQKLHKQGGQAWLSEKFTVSKVNLMDMLPEVDRSKERLASTLKDRCLGFLDPMLTIEPDLWAQMKNNDPSPAAVYRWIRDNVDQSIQATSTFAHVFIVCLLRYTHETASQRYKSLLNSEQKGSDSDNSNKSSPTNSSTQALGDIESDILSKYQHILQAIIKDKQMQLASLYALQTFYHGLDFPKGALLRWFNMFYDLSIVDDDVFFIWKEEINDVVPGKGQALFQVNTWLNWLAEPDSEDEEES